MARSALKQRRELTPRTHNTKPALTALAGAIRSLLNARRYLSRTSTAPGTKLRLETLEPRVLMDANPAALTITGAIDVPGEQDRYEFTLSEKTRVVFDSLTDNGGLTWRLDGPAGQLASRDFSSTDANSSFLPAFELDAGRYSLLIDGTNDATGGYELRVVDASTAADLVPGTTTSGILEGGKKTDVYRFTATAGDKFFLDGLSETGGSAYWRLIDPYGRQEIGISQRIGGDTETFAVQRTGVYLLMVEGSNSNTASVSYSFNLRPVVDTTSVLSLDTTTVANIDAPGKTANYTFNLAERTAVFFDGLSNSSQFFWALRGPDGQTVNRTQITNGATNDNRQWLSLAAGDYTLSIDANLATVGEVSFRMLTATAAQDLVPGTGVSANLDHAQATKLYRVALQAGDRLFMDGRSVTNGSASWRLIDPYGDLVASSTGLATLIDPFTVSKTGNYLLLLEGAASNNPAQTVAYDFTLNRVPNFAATLTLGDTVSNSIAVAGQATVYTFNLAAAARLVFDSQTNSANIQWSLLGPRGAEVTDRAFSASDASSGTAFLNLPAAGTYQLIVRGTGRTTGAYAFRLLDVANATPLTLGAAASGVLQPGNATQLYGITVAAGDRLAFDSISVAGGSATWRLIDPYGRDAIGSNNLATDRGAFLLTTPGTYTLEVEGVVGNVSDVNYSFQLSFVDNVPQAGLPAGNPLVVGETANGTLATAGSSTVYRFSLSQDSLLVFDTQTSNTAFTWSLMGPRGAEVTNRALYASDSYYSNPALPLVAGDYALTINANSSTGSYLLRLLDVASFNELPLGQTISATRSPSNNTIGYRFNATQGDSFLLGLQQGDGYWRVLDPYGNSVYAQYYYGTPQPFTAAMSGTYILLNEGDYYQTGNANVSFRLDQRTTQSMPLVFNDVIAGTVAGRYETRGYTFTLSEPTTIVLDPLETPSTRADSIAWRVSGSGTNNLGLSRWYPVTLGPGTYTLTVENSAVQPRSYNFRVLTRDAATVLAPDGQISGVFVPGGGARLYRFSGIAGQNIFIDGRDPALGWPAVNYWQLTDPFGRNVYSSETSYDRVQTLAVSGEYLLTVYHRFDYDAATERSYSLQIVPETSVSGSFAMDTDIAGTVSVPNQRVTYSFTLAAPIQVLVDTWGSNANFYWSLTGPRGSEASSRWFPDTWDNKLFSLPAGDYQLTVWARNLDTGTYNFRLADLSLAPTLPVNVPTQFAVAPGDRSRAMRFTVAEPTELMLDLMSTGGYYTSRWQIYAANGNLLADDYLNTDSSSFALAAGEYFLVVNGDEDTITDFQLALRVPTVKTEALSLGTVVNGTLDQGAQSAEYTFTLNGPTTLLFDSLVDSDDLRWDLIGPNGTVRSNVGFNGVESGSGTVLRLDAAGAYTLRVRSQTNSTGSFGFKLLDLSAAPIVTLGGNQSLTLVPGNSTQLIAFDAAADDFLSYQFNSISEGEFNIWLIRQDGTVERYPSNGRNNFSFDFYYTGRYVLVVQGGLTNAAPVDLNLRAELVRSRELALTLGAENSGMLGSGFITDTWAFSLANPARLLFDGLSGDANIRWNLYDAGNNLVRSGSSIADPLVFGADAGDFRLVISSGVWGGVPGDYRFRLIDVSIAEGLTIDAQVSAVLPASHAAQVFRLTTQTGDRLLLSATTTSGEPGRLAIFNSQGQQILNTVLPNATYELIVGSGFGMAPPGDYLVVVDSDFANPAPVPYSLSASRIQETFAPAALGDFVAGLLPGPQEYRSYRFTVDSSTRLIVNNAGSDAGIRYRLQPVGGNQSGWSSFPPRGSDSNIQYLNAGEYVLTVSNSNVSGGAYRIQLLDVSTAPALPESGVNGVLSNGRDAAAYAFNLTEQQRLNIQVSTADTALLGWVLYGGGDGRQVILRSSTGVPVDTDRLAAGRYTLVLFGAGSADASVAYFADVNPIPALPFTLGDQVSGSIPLTGDEVNYRFTLTQPASVLFDALSGDSNLIFELYTSSYDYVDDGYFASDTSDWERTLNLTAGTYFLNIKRPSWSQAAGSFSFRVASIAQIAGNDIVLGSPATGSLRLGTEVVAHRFTAAAGDTVSIVPTVTGGGAITWRLVDPRGQVAVPPRSGSLGELYLNRPGQYTLFVEGQLTNTAQTDYQFLVTLDGQVDPLPAGTPLVLGTPITGQVAGIVKPKLSLHAHRAQPGSRVWKTHGWGLRQLADAFVRRGLLER